MHFAFKPLTEHIVLTDDLRSDIQLFLSANMCSETAKHCMDVGTESRRIALMFNVDPDSAEIAGWLHDISAVFANNERLNVARLLQIDIFPEEETFPMIIHQKISKVMARDIFNIMDEDILNAVGCHTTLRSNSTSLDQVLFVADKISWDQHGIPPYIKELNRNIKQSLPQGAFSYINYLWERKESLRVIHPWLRDAFEDLRNKVQLV